MPSNSSEHHVPFNLFLFVVVILTTSFIMMVLDYSAGTKTQQIVISPEQEVMIPESEAAMQVPHKLSEQQYGAQIYYAYRTVNPFSTMIISPNEAFVIGTSPENIIAISNFPGWTTSDWLFDFVGDEMFVVNTQNNTIDVFSMIDNGAFYDRSLELPAYETGVLYGINCDASLPFFESDASLPFSQEFESDDENTVSCEVNTALHLEAGCSMTLDLTSETFSQPLCGGGYGEFFSTYIPDLK